MKALTECTFKDKVKIEGLGASASDAAVDATSLDNMAKSFQWMKRLNQIRQSVGLGELKVTHTLMAQAQADADYSDTKIAHAVQFGVWENVAWNYGSDPYSQWYDEEKVVFDEAVKKAGGPSGLTGKAAYDYYTAHSSEIDAFVPENESVGHYMNDIEPDLAYTGLAVCTRGTMYGWKTYAQVFHVYTSGDTAYTVDDYEKLFTAYKKNLDDKISAYTSAAAKADDAQKTLSSAQSDKKKAEDAYNSAVTAKKSADTDAVNKKASRDAAQTAKDSAEAEYNRRLAIAEKLLEEYNQAKAVAESAQTAFDQAEADRKSASDVWRAARIKLKKAERAYATAVKIANTKGKAYIDKQGMKYVSQGDGTAVLKSVTASFRKQARYASVAAIVKIDGIRLKVTAVGARVFSGCTALMKVTVGKYVTSIGSKAFYGCSRLKNIVINSSAITKVGASAFTNVYKTVTVKVPAANKTAYNNLFRKAGLSAKAIFA